MTRDEVMAEEINAMTTEMIDAILKIVSLSNEEQDELWNKLQPKLEEFFCYPEFRHYN